MSPLKNILKKTFAVAALTMAASTAHAGYTIARTDGGNVTQLVAGRDYEFVITNTDTPQKLQDINLTLTIANFDILVAPGIQTGSTKYSLDNNGKLFFGLRVYQSGSFSMTAANSQDPNDKGTLNNVQVQNYPVTYSITPNNPTVNANVPFNINITALDVNGVVVTAYEDPVQIVDSQLGTVTFVDGSKFLNGQAQNVAVTVKAANLNNQFTLTITLAGAQYYDSSKNLVPAATKTTSLINLIPDVFFKLAMLFPGETLVPGTGKTGTPTPQDSLVPVSLVTVQRVDQFFNPLLSNPATPISVQFASSQAGPDNPPFPFTLSMTGSNISIPAASNQVYFGGAGPRAVTATPDGDSSKSDSSNITVNTGAAESYTITMVGVPSGSSITTDNIVRVEIRAFDQNNNPLSTLFGKVANAELRAQLGTNEEKKEWVDTNVTTDFPDNDVIFGCPTCGGGGIAVMNLSVTKFGSGVRLHFVTPNRDAFSTPFNVDVGAPSRIHLTAKKASDPNQGETYSPGTYPGNSGTPPVTTAGEDMIVEARITDRRWNLISGGGSNYNMTITNNLPNHYLVGSNSHISGPPYTFPNNGELAFDPTAAFDKSFRVHFRTAGPNALVPAPQIKVVSNLSQNAFFSSSMTVLPAAYNQLVLLAPGETLRPGIDTSSEPDGKQGSPTPRQAGVSFTATAFATDAYFNPVVNGPFPNVNIGITPSLTGSFVSGSVPVQMVSGSRPFTITLQSDSSVRLSDVATPTIQQTVAIPVGSGLLDHFAMDTVASPQAAGVPFTGTIRALDKFGNVVNQNITVTLTPNTGATTMSPATVDLVNGVSAAGTTFTMFAATQTAKINMSNGSFPNAARDSNGFVVNVSPQGYQKLLLLLPGEKPFPGTAAGKINTPTPQTSGSLFFAKVFACDPYYNPLNTTGSVQLASNHLVQFGSAIGSFVTDDAGVAEYDPSIILKNATTHVITVIDRNSAAITPSTSTIVAQAGGYQQLQILADGEVNNPDSPLGKTGTPNAQKVAVPFNLTLNAVDKNWNIITSFNGGDTKLAASVGSVLFIPPNDADSGGHSPRPFVNGTITREVVIGVEGSITLSDSDDINLTLPGNSVTITVNPGPTYDIQAPATAVAGQPFAPVTITLQQNGTPVQGYNRSVFLTAVLANGGAAAGSFNPNGTPQEYVMQDGVVIITTLTYVYSEDIKIQLKDEFGRVGFSPNGIDVVPSGLKYRVTVPNTSQVVGLPSQFPVTVQLLDQNTNTIVRNHDHTVTVQVVSAENKTTDGSFTSNSARLSQGEITFNEAYTKAENIQVKIGESPTDGDATYTIPDSLSTNVSMIADGYKKLLLLAPNEVHVPGVISPTGKTGAPANEQKGVPFLMQVRAVDQFWNIVNDFNGGSVTFDSNDIPASLGSANPSNQGAPFVNGATAANIKLLNPGQTQVTIRDTSNAAIATQSDVIRVGGLYYQIDGEPTQQFTGTQAPFNISITLYDSNTTLPVSSAGQSFHINAKLPNGDDATGLLSVTSGQLASGTQNIIGESYSIAENIYLNVTDDLGNSGSSDIIVFVPRRINYVITAPAEAIVDKPFSLSVQAVDAFTNTNVKNLNRIVQLSAISALTGTTVKGSFTPATLSISGGVGTLEPTYTLAEPISVQVIDNSATGVADPTNAVTTQAGSINVHPGPLATIDGIQDFQMQSNEEKTFTLIARDGSGNPIPGQKIKFSVQLAAQSAAMALNGDVNSPTIQANGQGELSVRFTPTNETNGRVEVVMSDADVANGYATLLVVNVLGITRRPAGALDIGANRIPIHSKLPLQINLSVGAGATIRTFYRLGDSGSFQPYNPSIGAEGFDETKTYTVEWKSEACYDVLCTSPVQEFSDPNQFNSLMVTTYQLDNYISAYPSPFNPKASGGENYITIQYGLAQASSVEINIYDLMGQKVWHKDIDAGAQGGEAKVDNRVFWFGINDNGTVVANGGYITTVKVGSTGQIMKTKILVVK